MQVPRGALCLLLSACAMDAPLESGRDLPVTDGVPGYELTYLECTDGADTDDDGRTDCVDPDCHRWEFCGRTQKADDGSCAYLRAAATPKSDPVDFLWAIDSSGSMIDIAEVAQREMGTLSAALLNSGVDFRLVLLTAGWLESVPASLRNDGRYLFVPQAISSNDAFTQLIARGSDYRGFLRPGAETVTGPMLVRSPVATNGRTTAKMRKGTSTSKRRPTCLPGAPLRTTSATPITSAVPRGTQPGAGVATTARAKVTRPTILACAGKRCRRVSPAICRWCA